MLLVLLKHFAVQKKFTDYKVNADYFFVLSTTASFVHALFLLCELQSDIHWVRQTLLKISVNQLIKEGIANTNKVHYDLLYYSCDTGYGALQNIKPYSTKTKNVCI